MTKGVVRLPTLPEEIRDAVTPRAVLLVVGVLLLQLGFVLSYVGAFHAPTPQRIHLGLVAPSGPAQQLAGRLDRLPGHPVSVQVVPDEATARHRIGRGDLSAALVANPSGTTDRLLTASGGGSSVVTAVQEIVGRVEQSQGRSAQTTDVV